jgi:hypothetical protein
MIDLNKVKNIHLYSSPVDMRIGMSKIEMILSISFSPIDIMHSLFIFVSRNRRQLKIYYENEYGKWLLINKLSYATYLIPNYENSKIISKEDLDYLLKGVLMVSERKKLISA